MQVRRLSDTLFRWKGPTAKTTGTVLDQAYLTANGGVVQMRVYQEMKETRVAHAKLPLRLDSALGATSLTIPHSDSQFIYAGDILSITLDSGEILREGVNTFTPGTGPETPATNFDTITVNAISGPASAGNLIWVELFQHVRSGTPVVRNERMVIDRLELFQIDYFAPLAPPGFAELSPNVIEVPVWTQDGKPAKNVPGGYVVLIGPLTATQAWNVGERVRVQIAGPLTMAQYGAAATWTSTDPSSAGGGYQVIFGFGQQHVAVGDTLRVEFVMSGMVGLNNRESFLVTVVD